MNRRLFFPVVGLVLGMLGTALLLELVLRTLPVADATLALPVSERNPVPRLQPNREFLFSKGWSFAIRTWKRTNNYGFLSDYDYTREGGRPLLAVIGDSYVEAMQVKNAESLVGLLSEVVGSRGRVYALGTSGTGLSTYLAYASYAAREFAPDALAFNIISNDFDESLLAYQTQPRNHYFVPGSDGELILWRFDYSPSFLKRVARRSALVRYLLINCQLTPARLLAAFGRDGPYVANTRADFDTRRLADSYRVVDAFFRLLPEHTALPTDRISFVVDGIRPNLYSADETEDVRGSYPRLMRDYFIEAAIARGYEVTDLQPVFAARHRKTGERFEFPTDHHWNSLGHRVAAGAVCRSASFARLFHMSSVVCPG